MCEEYPIAQPNRRHAIRFGMQMIDDECKKSVSSRTSTNFGFFHFLHPFERVMLKSPVNTLFGSVIFSPILTSSQTNWYVDWVDLFSKYGPLLAPASFIATLASFYSHAGLIKAKWNASMNVKLASMIWWVWTEQPRNLNSVIVE